MSSPGPGLTHIYTVYLNKPIRNLEHLIREMNWILRLDFSEIWEFFFPNGR